MGAQENRRLMQDIFSGLSTGDGSLLIASLVDSFCWTVMGTTKWSRTYRGKLAVQADLLRPLLSKFEDQYTNNAQRFIAEGEYVVVECRGLATTKSGEPYSNAYCWICRISDGKLEELIEYGDTQLIAKVLGDPS